jgi:transposase-like protein
MKLSPVGPPTGHRRARRYAPQMLELRSRGYTFEAIREALADAGVNVSNSTVQREVARHQRHSLNRWPSSRIGKRSTWEPS